MRVGVQMSMKELLRATETAKKRLPSKNSFERVLVRLFTKEMLGFFRGFVTEWVYARAKIYGTEI